MAMGQQVIRRFQAGKLLRISLKFANLDNKTRGGNKEAAGTNTSEERTHEGAAWGEIQQERDGAEIVVDQVKEADSKLWVDKTHKELKIIVLIEEKLNLVSLGSEAPAVWVQLFSKRRWNYF